MEGVGPQKVYDKILAVMQEIGAVPKTGKNNFIGYEYSSSNDVVSSVRPIMIKHSLIMIPVGCEDIGYSKDGQVTQHTQSYDIICTEDGTFVRVSVRAGGEDKGDKAPYKANTGAQKYAIKQTFMLPDEENDPDDDKNKTIKPQSAGPAPRPKPEPKPAPQPTTPGGNPPPEPVQKSYNGVLGEEVRFGKHKGSKWGDLDMNYLDWIAQKSTMNEQTKAKARECLDIMGQGVDEGWVDLDKPLPDESVPF